MSETTEPYVFAVTQLLGVTLIDTERTVAVRLRGTDGTETAILLPVALTGDLVRELRTKLPASASTD